MLGVTLDERVPEIDVVGLGDAVEDGDGVGEVRRERGAERDEAGDEEVVLLSAFADDLGMDLFETWDGFTGRQKRWE